MRSANVLAIIAFATSGIILLTGCDRFVLPPLPTGVPDGALFVRRTRLWLLNSGNLERAFYDNGAPAYEGALKGGVRDGDWRSYAPDGKTVTTSGQYRKGRRDGTWLHFDDRGRLYVKMVYAEAPFDPVLSALSPETGNENGPFERYYPDGRIELTGSYKAGLFEGAFRRVSRTGKTEYEGRYVKGARQGLWRIYNSRGELLREEQYENGQLQGKLTQYAGRSPSFETIYDKGKEVGPRRWFKPPVVP